MALVCPLEHSPSDISHITFESLDMTAVRGRTSAPPMSTCPEGNEHVGELSEDSRRSLFATALGRVFLCR